MPLETEDSELRRNREAFHDQRAELKRLYPEQWVAVRNGEVIAHTNDHSWMEEALIQLGGRRGWNVTSIFIGSTTHPFPEDRNTTFPDQLLPPFGVSLQEGNPKK
jgi:hypothetical protein